MRRALSLICGAAAVAALLSAQDPLRSGTGVAFRIVRQGSFHPDRAGSGSAYIAAAKLFGVTDEAALARTAPVPNPGPASVPAPTGEEMDFTRLTALADAESGVFQRVAGPRHIVTLSGLWIHTERRGTAQGSVSFRAASLWSAAADETTAQSARLADLQFDAASGCWTILARESARTLLAVSVSDDPTGDWNVFVLDGTSPDASQDDNVRISRMFAQRALASRAKVPGMGRSAASANAVADIPGLSFYGGAASGMRTTFSYYATTSSTPIRQLWFMVSPTLSAANSCWVFYDTSSSKFGLVADNGSSEIGRISPGQSGSLGNSQCTLESGTATAATNYVNASITVSFKPSFAGSKALFLYADTTAGTSSGWQVKGTFLVSPGNLPPRLINTSSTGGAGLDATFSLSAADGDGTSDIRQIWFLISSGLNSRNACWVFYSAGQFGLVNDAGTGEAGRITNSSQEVSNSQCTLYSVSGGDYSSAIQLSFRLRFSGAFAGVKEVYGYVDDLRSNNTGWQYLGYWAVPKTPTSLPAPSFSSQGSGYSATPSSSDVFTLTFQDTTSAANLRQGWALVSQTLDGRNACWIVYDRATNQVGLVSDSGTAEVGRLVPGRTATIENSQCVLSGGGISVSEGSAYYSPTTITVTVPVRFKSTMDGIKNIYMYADNLQGISTGWTAQGSISILSRNLPPFTPSAYFYNYSPFRLQISGTDPNSASDLSQIWVVVTPVNASGLAVQNACWIFADFNAGQVGLVNNAGTADAGRLNTGSTLSVSNSQCTIQSISMSGGSAILSVAFAPGFAGTHQVFSLAMDQAGLNSGWTSAGTITTQ